MAQRPIFLTPQSLKQSICLQLRLEFKGFAD